MLKIYGIMREQITGVKRVGSEFAGSEPLMTQNPTCPVLWYEILLTLKLSAHVERLNNTLRQRLGRLARQTLSFSKSLMMHKACLHLFLHRYNLARAATFR